MGMRSSWGRVVLATIVVLGGAVSTPARAGMNGQLLRCSETSFGDGYYGTLHASPCGGDPLERASMGIVANRYLHVTMAGAHPFNLYEVYWLEIGGDLSTGSLDPVYVGNFVTDCDGQSDELLRPLEQVRDIWTASPLPIRATAGAAAAGNFLIYSRGPWGNTDDGSCRPVFMSSGSDPIHPDNELHNPELGGWDGVQFISGYAVPNVSSTGIGDQDSGGSSTGRW